jgi:dihydrofolate synthase / folylpolyglutamate synthase
VAPLTPADAVAYVEALDILGMRLGLERMHRLLASLGDPHLRAPAVHVVGTNGKSSTTRLAAGVLRAHGHRVGAYLSPHITGWHERTEIDGAAVGPAAFAAAVGEVRDAAGGLGLPDDDGVTQFEVLTAAAFVAMAQAGVDAMVVEAGLGGRYDATNVLGTPRAVVLTTVGIEHTEFLGDTLAAIAGEKLAVAPDGYGGLVLGRLSPPAADAVEAICRERRLSGWRVGREITVATGPGGVTVTCPGGVYDALPLGLRGGFQRDNLAAALGACERFRGGALDPAAVRAAVASVRVPGRLEVFPGTPPVVLDGAHNPDGMEALVAALPEVRGDRPLVAVVSLLADKDAGRMLGMLTPHCSAVVATRSAHRRARPAADVAKAARAHGARTVEVEDPVEALEGARRLAGPGGVVLVCGSLYLLVDLRPLLDTRAEV